MGNRLICCIYDVQAGMVPVIYRKLLSEFFTCIFLYLGQCTYNSPGCLLGMDYDFSRGTGTGLYVKYAENISGADYAHDSDSTMHICNGMV